MNSESFSSEIASSENDYNQKSFEMYPRYSVLLSELDPPDRFSEDTWLFAPSKQLPLSVDYDSPVTDLHNQLTSVDANSPSVDNLKRSLLTHLRQRTIKTSNDNLSTMTAICSSNDNPSETDCDYRCRKSDVSLQTERQFEQLNSMQDVIDVEITAKMQEEYLQRSVFEIAKKLEECQCYKENNNKSSSNRNATARYNKPGKIYGIRSNTQTLRVSPTRSGGNNQSTPIRPLTKYGNRSNTQTLRISPISHNTTRTLSVPRSRAASNHCELKLSLNRQPQNTITNSPRQYKEVYDSALANNVHQSRQILNRSNELNCKETFKRSMSSGPKVSKMKNNNIVKCVTGGTNAFDSERIPYKPSFLPRLKTDNLYKRKFKITNQSTEI